VVVAVCRLSVPDARRAVAVVVRCSAAVVEDVVGSGGRCEGVDVFGSEVLGSDVAGSDVAGSVVFGLDVLGSDVLGSDVLGSDVLGSDILDSVVFDPDFLESGVEVLGEDVGAEVAEDVGAVDVDASAGLGARTAADSGNAASSATAERLRSGRRGNVTVGVFRQRCGHVRNRHYPVLAEASALSLTPPP